MPVKSTTPKTPVEKPPHDTRAEQATLGCILRDSQQILECQRVLKTADMFFKPEHQIIYQAMLDVAEKNKAAEPVAVMDRLVQKGLLEEVGGATYFGHLAAQPAIDWALHYAETVHKCYQCRRIIDASKRMEIKARGKADPADVITETVEELVGLEGSSATKSPKDVFERYKKWYETNQLNHRVGLRTGIYEIDSLMPMGIQDDMLVIVAARPSDGKTSLMLSIAHNLALGGKYTLIASAETGSDRLMQRIHNLTCPHMEFMRLEAAKDWSSLRGLRERYWGRIEKVSSRLYIQDGERDIESIGYAIRAEIKRHPEIGLVCIDYLQKIQTKDRVKDDFNRLNTVLRKLDTLRASIKRPVILLSQLNRDDIDQKYGPTLKHLKGTGDIEQDADVVMLLWNKSPDHETDVDITCRVAKQRDGPKGDVQLRFLKPQYLMISPSKGRKDKGEQEELEDDGSSGEDIPF